MTVQAQQNKPVADMDFIKIKNGKAAEAMFFYENNWKVFRDAAVERGFIKSYKLFTTSSDSLADFHIILFTEYKDSVQYNNQEKNFRPLLREFSPGGPKLLNALRPKDFATILFSKKTVTECGN